MDRYKRENRRPFPTWSEVLEVLRSLGYRRVAEAGRCRAGRRRRTPSVTQTPGPGAGEGVTAHGTRSVPATFKARMPA